MGTFLDYFQLLDCIPKEWIVKLKTEQVADEIETSTLGYLVNVKGKITSKVYQMLIAQEKYYEHGKVAWQVELKTKFELSEWKEIRRHRFHIALDPKLRLFQYRLLSKKVTTNVVRNLWVNTISPLCSFCNEKKETTIHLFCHCEKVKQFWQKIKRWMLYICKIDLNIEDTALIINKSNESRNNKFIDYVIPLAKQYIYASKCKNEELNVNVLLTKLHEHYCTEKSIAVQTNRLKAHNCKWQAYENVIKY